MKKPANLLLKVVSILLALFVGLTRFNPKSGGLHVLLWSPKLAAASLSAVLAAANAFFVVVGLKRRDPLITLAGVVGVLAGSRYVAGVTESRDRAFDAAFGPNWESQTPVHIRERLKTRRWNPICLPPPLGPLQRNVLYGGNVDTGQPLFADIQEPPHGAPRSGLAMIYIHGGGWRYGSRNIDKFPYFRRLAHQGHVIMDIDYSLSERASLVEMVVDVKRAILWLKENADHYQVNPDCIVLAGQSAGAHLALMAAYTPNQSAFQPLEVDGDTAVRAVVSYYGPTDMWALHDQMRVRFGRAIDNRFKHQIRNELRQRHVRVQGSSLADGIAGLMGGSPDQIPDTYTLLSPITHAGPASPPTLLLHGTHDFLVPVEQSQRLHEKLHRSGATSILLTYDGCDHSYESVWPKVSPPAQASAYYLERFLALMVGETR
jgi:acetyl esterase/lipase